jgi:YhcH/YjgK/YiaL family protein
MIIGVFIKNLVIRIMILTGLFNALGCKSSTDPSKWSSNQIDKWFEKGECFNGWEVKPDPSINRKAFTVSYFKNKDKWDKAFIFLKDSNLPDLEIKRYDIDGDKVYAIVSEYVSKNEEDIRYEAHQEYIDIQYVIDGKELIGLAPLINKKDVLAPYDLSKDVEFMTVTRDTNLIATQANFFIFFPEDAHRPGMKDGENSKVKKIVVKIKIK